MNWKSEAKPLLLLIAVFLLSYFLPVGHPRFDNAVREALFMLNEYARDHVLLCLVPAFFIAGAIGVFIRQASVMRYLGPQAPRTLAYGVASVAGTILAVCSCTVLPLFAGIYRMGAGLGPAVTFLYAGPAINALAIILTARILGWELGLARALGAVLFSILIGLCMHWLHRKEEREKVDAAMHMPQEEPPRPLSQTALFFALMVGILLFANWARPETQDGVWFFIYQWKWPLTALLSTGLALVLVAWFQAPAWQVALAALPAAILALITPQTPTFAFFAGVIGLSILTSRDKGELGTWFATTWEFAKQIFPLLFFGVLAAGFLLGRPGHEGIIPSTWITHAVGGNSITANLLASVIAAFMYFATLTEIPILQGLLGSGMGNGPALALLLAGPALSLPSMLVIHSIMGTRKTAWFVVLVIVMAAISGLFFGIVSQEHHIQ
ncbi:MAG: permease [bacterium]|jgi:uncharacterized membrane protein YraQ (UPF0718 family)|nr:permease [bacterium]